MPNQHHLLQNLKNFLPSFTQTQCVCSYQIQDPESSSVRHKLPTSYSTLLCPSDSLTPNPNPETIHNHVSTAVLTPRSIVTHTAQVPWALVAIVFAILYWDKNSIALTLSAEPRPYSPYSWDSVAQYSGLIKGFSSMNPTHLPSHLVSNKIFKL